MAKAKNIKSFPIAPDDPLAEEHAAVAAWVTKAFASLSKDAYYHDVDMKSLSEGERLLSAKPEQARRYVAAAVVQAMYWDQEAAKFCAQAATEAERASVHSVPGWRASVHSVPGWRAAWGSRRQATAVVYALMRRTLPFQEQDLISLLQWCCSTSELTSFFAPVGAITRALERYVVATPVGDELRSEMRSFAFKLREAYDKDVKRLGTTVEQLCAEVSTPIEAASSSVASQPAPRPALAGTSHVLDALKKHFGLPLPAEEPATTLIGPDQFPMNVNSPLQEEHALLSALFEELLGTPDPSRPDLKSLEVGRVVLNRDAPSMGKLVLASTERRINSLLEGQVDFDDRRSWQSREAATGVIEALLPSQHELDRDGFFDLLLYIAADKWAKSNGDPQIVNDRLIKQAETEAEKSPLTEGERYILWLFRASLIPGPLLGASSPEVTRLTHLINDNAAFYLSPGEAWSDAVNGDLAQSAPATKPAWAALLKHSLSATSSRPSPKWLANGTKLVNAVGADDVRQALLRWLPLVAQGRTIPRIAAYVGDTRGAGDVMNEENASCLRGLLWLVQTIPRAEQLARVISATAISAYKKVPGIGPRAVKVGNAAVYALSEMRSTDAVGQLAMLKVRIKFGTAQKEIEKAFNAAAEALGLPRDQIEELGVPSYGMDSVGSRAEIMGDYRAELIVTGSDAEIKWFDSRGKPLKAVPAKVKRAHQEDWKDLQQSLKDIQSMLPAQRDRLDSMFLLRKSWPLETWRDRYLNHPLIGTIARRLIWNVDGTPACFLDGKPTDVKGGEVTVTDSAQVALWHPIGCPVDEITAWRRRLEEIGITQPFKQAHREVYLLTDAERNTRTYSNRFAAHILRQHQFNALCAARGWKNKLRLMVDDTYPPATRELSEWGLRAEFWIEGIGEEYGEDTNDSGVYLRLSTDQVRFYRTGAAQNWAHAGGGGYESQAGPGPGGINQPLPLEDVPELVFSEIMRDVDLFVGVASVGNDPAWQDGGPDARYRNYWREYSFGELSGTATTRKQVLQRLIPRLKIADRCTFADRFLVVRGSKRTYKIHLGSGNILMEPNDEYLCIVPDSRARSKQGDLFLPFEGDGTLSIILSKAILLADDAKISDPTITQQIDRR